MGVILGSWMGWEVLLHSAALLVESLEISYVLET